MSALKLFLILGMAMLSIALGGLYFKNRSSVGNQWLDVVLEQESSSEREYSDYWDERENGIGMLKMQVKLIPNIDTSKNNFLLAYKAEIALNPQALKLSEGERHYGNILDFLKGPYDVELWFSLLDEDGFRLDLIWTESDETKISYTCSFSDLTAVGKSQLEQAIITSCEISPLLAKRIKKVSVDPHLKRYKE